MDQIKAIDELRYNLGKQLRLLRLRRGLDQRELAREAGVALNVVKGLESGRGATVTSLIKVLRILGQADWLATLAPAVSISPLEMVKSRPARQRAFVKRRRV
jgi:transcriptional regulator with XRE-family HTH domain